MTIKNLLDKKGLEAINAKMLKKMGEILAENENIEIITKWLHYDLQEPSHISQFLEMAEEIHQWGIYQADICLENSYYDELVKNGYYSDLAFGAWDKNIIDFYNADFNEDLINEFFENNNDIIKQEWQNEKNHNLRSLILLTTRRYIEWTLNLALELNMGNLKK